MGYQDRPYHQDDDGGMSGGMFTMPKPTPLTLALIGVCLVVLLLESITRSAGSPLIRWGELRFQNGLAWREPWRWITYQYLHGGAAHYFFNMIGVYFFVPPLEAMWGWRKTFAFYTAGGIVAGAVYGIFSLFFLTGGLIGASGSIFAVLGAVALLSPQMQIILVFFAVPIRIAAALFAGFFVLSAVVDGDLSNAAHLGGLAFGFLAPYYGRGHFAGIARKLQHAQQKREMLAEQHEQAGIDAILAKVSAHGMQSLSWFEKRTLRKATEHQRARDLARAQKYR